MPRMYFNEHMAVHQIQAHMAVMVDKDNSVELPIVNGVIRIPDELHDKVVLPLGWVPYTGRSQASVNPEELQPLEDVDKFYGGKKGRRNSGGGNAGTGGSNNGQPPEGGQNSGTPDGNTPQ
jgi:hypothetical protein